MNDHEKQMLQDIHSAVIGNESLGHRGLVKRVDDAENWIRRADIKLATVVGAAGVVVFLVELYFKHS